MNIQTLASVCALTFSGAVVAHDTEGDAPSTAPSGIQLARAGYDFKVSGRLGAGTTLLNHQTGGGTSESLTDNLLETSWLRLSGSADLSGGMGALFRLETGVATDTGAAGGTGSGGSKFWNRQSWVGMRLPDSTGVVTLGRQFHAGADRAIRTYDVYHLQGSSIQVVPLALFGVNRFNGSDSRVDNSIKYRLSVPSVLELGASVGASEGSVGKSESFDVAHAGQHYEIGLSYLHYDAPTRIASTGQLPQHQVIALGGNVQVGTVQAFLAGYGSKLDSTVAGRLKQKNKVMALGLDWRIIPVVSLKTAWYGDKGETLDGVAGRDGHKNTWVASAQYLLTQQFELSLTAFENKFSGGYRVEPVNIAALGRDPKASSVAGASAGLRFSF